MRDAPLHDASAEIGGAGTVNGDAHAAPVAVPLTTHVDPVSDEETPGVRPERQFVLNLVLADLAALVLATSFAASWIASGAISRHVALIAVLIATLVAVFKLNGLYDNDRKFIGHSTLDELPTVLRLVAFTLAIFALVAWRATEAPSLGEIIVFGAIVVGAIAAVRATIRALFRRNPDFPQNTVIVGAGSVGQLLARKLLTHPEYQVRLVGFVDSAPKERRPDLDDLTVVGVPEELPNLIERYKIERVVIAFSNDSPTELIRLIRSIDEFPVRVDIVPRLFDAIPPGFGHHAVEGIPLLPLPQLRLSRSARAFKRAFDLVGAAAGMALLAPFFALVALAIKLDTPGPVFFRQLRMGAGDETFWMYKFRTMTADADERKAEYAHLNKHTRPGGDPRMFKIERDPRVTRVGRFLRASSLDELPQLFNVLRGEMSLVGPRPLIIDEDSHVEPWARKRLALRPGMTGLWQVIGRTAISFDEMVRLDYLYVATWSFSSDLRYLLHTFPLIVKGSRAGAF